MYRETITLDIINGNKNGVYENYTLLLSKRKYPKSYMHYYCYSYSINNIEKIERILYISGLEYKTTKERIYLEIKIYLYSIKDFDRYIEVLRHIYGSNRIMYNKKEVDEFYK